MFAIFPEILHAAEKGDQETLSCLVRKYFAGQDLYAPRLRVESLLESLGIAVTREQAPYFARIQVIDHRGQYRVTVSLSPRIESFRELNYTLAHLLGYFLNHHLLLMAEAELTADAYQLEASLVSRLSQRSTSRDLMELSLADRFALALLMPLGMVKKAHQTLRDEEDCAGFFQVPRQLLRIRLTQIQGVPQTVNASKDAEALPTAQASPREDSRPKKSKPQQTPPSVSKGTTNSLARAQQSVVSRSYRQEGARLDTKAPSESTTEAPGSGMKRLRELAKKIDKSVDS